MSWTLAVARAYSLSLAARAGAKLVVAVDGSTRIAGFATKNCQANKLHKSSGGPIEVVTGALDTFIIPQ